MQLLQTNTHSQQHHQQHFPQQQMMDNNLIINSEHQMLIGNEFFQKYSPMATYTNNNIQLQPRMHHLPLQHQPIHPRPRRRRSNHSLVASMDPEAVARRNERERNRVKQVNDGFDALRKKVPFLPNKKKLSKVDILRCAMMYIRDLKGVVEEYDHNNTHYLTHALRIKTRPNGSFSSSTSSSSDDLILLEQDLEDDLLGH
uniref:Asca-2 n=1 Tax=Clytia hemisphaerica TaxID=252671 RepID=A0A0P0F205_9CNID|nr:Asca-2 [Clytia hemisphaerica]